VFASSVTFAPSPSYGDGPDPLVIPDGNPPPQGDPDGTAGPGKQTGGRSRALPGTTRYVVSSKGDGGSARSVWVWRLHVVLQSLIARYSR
jgi:hypothetical protein